MSANASHRSEKISVYMYWMQGKPPDDVHTIIKSWEALPQLDVQLFDDDTAKNFIQDQFGGRYVKAYQRCKIPAMRADFFRLCILEARGGVYTDVDCEVTDFDALYAYAEGDGLLILRRAKREHGWNVRNDFIVALRPHTPILQYALEIALTNIEQRLDDSVWLVSGPGILTFYHYEDPSRFKNWRLLPESLGDKYIRVHAPMYKKTDLHWLGRKDLYY